MMKSWRSFIRLFHPEGIPQPGAVLYDFISKNQAFQWHYNLVAAELAQSYGEGRIVDVGTGPGWLLVALQKAMPHAKLEGVDISAAMVAKAAKNMMNCGYGESIPVRVGSAVAMPFADASLDVVVSTGSIHHWKEPQRGLAEIYRVLKPGGTAFIYDLVQKLPPEIAGPMKKDFGRFRMMLLWLHTFEEPFYNVAELAALAEGTPFRTGETHFTGALCCLVLRK